jgi:hypothetical protein
MRIDPSPEHGRPEEQPAEYKERPRCREPCRMPPRGVLSHEPFGRTCCHGRREESSIIISTVPTKATRKPASPKAPATFLADVQPEKPEQEQRRAEHHLCGMTC